MATSEAELDELIDDLVSPIPPKTTEPVKFLGEQFDRGLAWVHFPRRRRGLGGTPADQLYALRKISKSGAPSAIGRNVIGYGMVAPTVVTHGTQEQKSRFLRPLFTGEEIWCQLSPNRAPARTSPVSPSRREGRRRVDLERAEGVDDAGPRIGLRTHPRAHQPRRAQAPRDHAFLVDMRAPGVEVRPLFQATGEAEFNECFFVDARVPDASASVASARGGASRSRR